MGIPIIRWRLYGGDSSTVRVELNKWINERDKNVQSFVEFFDTRDLAILAGEYKYSSQSYFTTMGKTILNNFFYFFINNIKWIFF
jgi:hypothetical protein